jgi:PKD repeat protein
LSNDLDQRQPFAFLKVLLLEIIRTSVTPVSNLKKSFIMKRIVCLAILSLFLTFTGNAQNYTFEVTGTVISHANGVPVPVPNQAVDIIVDSTGNSYYYQNTVFTDSTGFFNDYIYLPPEAGIAFVTVSTFDQCLGYDQSITAVFAPGAQLPPFDFFLCDNNPPECMAMFYWDYNPVNSLSVQFYDASFGSYTEWLWDFGDGTTSTEANPLHTFQDDGLYMVCLTISDSAGDCYSTNCDWVQAGQNWWGCDNFFSYYFTDSLTAEFTGYVFDSVYTVLSYDWDFGDGTTGSGQTITHSFTPMGNSMFLVCLTTTAIMDNGDTCTAISCQDVFIGFPPPPSPCESYFFPLNQAGLTVDFEAFTFSPHPTDFSWDFGDNTLGTGQFVSHAYAQEGIYMVTLNTIDTTGCEYEYTMEVWVGGLPGGCDNYFYYEEVDSLTFTFTGDVIWNDSVNAYQSQYFWDFGDGTTGTGQTITHTFQGNPVNGGNFFLVCLSTISYGPNGDSCFATSCHEIWTGTYPLYSAFGYVFLANGVVADDATVRLMATDSLWLSVIEVGATTVNDSGFYYFDSIPMYNNRLHFVQAELNEGSAWYGQYLPTYHLSALTWLEAMPVMPYNNWTHDIYMIEGTPVNSGSGVITGHVTQLGTRGVLEGLEIILLNQDLEPYVYTRSDENGDFSFEGLAFGTYMIHAEMMGVNPTPAMITLDEDQPEATVEVQVSGGEANYVFGVTEQLKSLSSISDIYPNPARGNAMVEVTSSKAVQLELNLYNQVGQVSWSSAMELDGGTKRISLPTGQLPAGFYYLMITTSEGDFVSRRLVKSY